MRLLARFPAWELFEPIIYDKDVRVSIVTVRNLWSAFRIHSL